MAAEVLFTITQEQLETGMRGYPVGYCTTSSVDPIEGLAYVGKPIVECAQKSPEEVIYLLFYGKEGTPQEIEDFSQELKKRQPAPEGLLKAIKALPRNCHPMTLFGISLLLAQNFSGTGDYKEDALRVVAQIPEITATVINHHAGWTQKPSRKDLGYMENFTQMLGVPMPIPSASLRFFASLTSCITIMTEEISPPLWEKPLPLDLPACIAPLPQLWPLCLVQGTAEPMKSASTLSKKYFRSCQKMPQKNKWKI